MKTYYVEHSVVTTASYTIIAKDDEDLKVKLAEREEIFKAQNFSSKIPRDKAGKPIGFDMDPIHWSYAPKCLPWTGTL